MAEQIIISVEKLKEVLAEAFDEGWSSYQELKDEVIERLMEKCDRFKIAETTTYANSPIYVAPPGGMPGEGGPPAEAMQDLRQAHMGQIGIDVSVGGPSQTPIRFMDVNDLPRDIRIIAPDFPTINIQHDIPSVISYINPFEGSPPLIYQNEAGNTRINTEQRSS